MSDATVIALVVYGVLGLLAWLSIYRSAPEGAAWRYAIWTPITTAAFLGVVRVMWGVLPLAIVWLVIGVTLINALLVRFCARCGAVRMRRGWGGTSRCRRCDGQEFVSLWIALKTGRDVESPTPESSAVSRPPIRRVMLDGTLSSSMTIFYKYVFLPIWSGGFGYGTFLLFEHPETVTFNRVRGGAPHGIEWLFLGAWVLGTGLLSLFALRLRSVRVSGDILYLGSFAREVEVHRRQVLRAELVPWLMPAVVRLMYITPEGLERTVWFMPRFRWLSGQIDDNLVSNLNALAPRPPTPAA